MRATRILAAALVLAILSGTGRAETAKAYRGPMNELPKAFAPPSADGPAGTERLASRSRQVEGLDRWEFWWETNRGEWLRAALAETRDERAEGATATVWAGNLPNAALVGEDDVKGLVVPVLLRALGDGDPEMRALAAVSLGKAQVSQAFGPLKALLDGPPGPDRRAAALALGFLREPLAAPALIEFMKRSGVSAAERAYAALGLGFLGSDEGAPALRDALTASMGAKGDAVEEYQAAISAALGLLGDRKAVPVLLDLVRNHNGRSDQVRASALVALGRIGDTAALPYAIAALEDNDVDVRRAAAQALGLFGRRQAVPALTKAFESDGDVAVRNFSAIALARTGGREVGELLESGLDLRNPRALRGFSALALGILGDRSRADSLRALLDLPSEPSLVGAAAIGLALLRDVAARPRLRMLASDPKRDDDLRGYALTALAMLGDPLSRDAAREAAADRGSAHRRRAGLNAISLYPEMHAGPVILGRLFEETDPYVRGAAIDSMGFLPRRELLDPLLVVAKERGFSADAKKDAVAALGVLALRGRPSPVTRFLDGVNYRSLADSELALLGIL